MNFVSDSQRRAVFSRLMGNRVLNDYNNFARIPGPQRLENEIKPLVNPTFREHIDFEGLYDESKTYAQNKKNAIKELKSQMGNFSDESLAELEREERALKKKVFEMNESSDRDARSEILRRLEKLDAQIKKKSVFSLDEYNMTPRAYKRLRGDLLEGLAANQITPVEYAQKMLELDARKQEYDNL